MGLFDLFKNKNEEEQHEPEDLSIYESEEFEMIIDDVFVDSINKKTILTGYVTSGLVYVGDTVKIGGMYETKVVGIEAFLKKLQYAFKGNKIGLVVENIDKECINKRRYNYKIKL